MSHHALPQVQLQSQPHVAPGRWSPYITGGFEEPSPYTSRRETTGTVPVNITLPKSRAPFRCPDHASIPRLSRVPVPVRANPALEFPTAFQFRQTGRLADSRSSSSSPRCQGQMKWQAEAQTREHNHSNPVRGPVQHVPSPESSSSSMAVWGRGDSLHELCLTQTRERTAEVCAEHRAQVHAKPRGQMHPDVHRYSRSTSRGLPKQCRLFTRVRLPRCCWTIPWG